MIRCVVNSITVASMFTLVSLWGLVPVYGEQSIEEMVRQGVREAEGCATSEGSGKLVPNHSKEGASAEAERMDKLDDAEMKRKAHQAMTSADSGSAEGIARDAMSKKMLDGFEEAEIFTKAGQSDFLCK